MTLAGEPTANRGIKIRLYPTEEQANKMLHNMQVARFSYNWARRFNLEEYANFDKACQEYKQSLPEDITPEELEKLISEFKKNKFKDFVHQPRKVNTLFTAEIKANPEKYAWFGDFDSYARNYSVALWYDNAVKNFKRDINKNINRVKEERKKLAKKGKTKNFEYPRDYGFPQYKENTDAKAYPTVVSKKNLDIENHKVFLPKIGWVKFNKNQQIPNFEYPSKDLGNPSVSTDGRGFYLSFSYYQPFEPYYTEDTDVLGIDLGIKNVAILSDGTIIPNVAKNPTVIKLNNKLKKLQRKLNWLVEHSEKHWQRKQEVSEAEWKKEQWKIETRQTRRLKQRITKVQIDLNNYKNNLLHNQCSNIIKKNPEGLVFETLNIKGMHKNKHLSSTIQQTGMYKFENTLIWHAKKHNIKAKKVDTFFPSSQICSNCGYQHIDMKDLSKRVFECPNCGMKLDRDINASINLKKQWDNPDIKFVDEKS